MSIFDLLFISFHSEFNIANNMAPNQTVPQGAVLLGFILTQTQYWVRDIDCFHDNGALDYNQQIQKADIIFKTLDVTYI